uniref:tRNA methyltransferase 5 n=1 Tax=Sinocyclocheilus grahami TaxID=75366 RepID=A0A672RHF8_SINGR
MKRLSIIPFVSLDTCTGHAFISLSLSLSLSLTNRSGRLLFLLQKHHSCISLSQNLNQFARIYLQCSSVVHSQKAMTDQPQTDLGLYNQTVSVPAIRIPTSILNKVVKSLKKVALQRPGLKRVVEEHNEDGNKDSRKGEHRLLLLDPNSITSADSFGSEEAEALKAYGVPQEIQKYQLKLTYENLKSEEILQAVLPEGQDVTSGFSRVGQVIIDKNPGVTCVVNKTNTIDSTYRNFQMEVLAGESNMVAKVRENGVLYEFDFSLVYWNPRLSTEHECIVSLLQRRDTVVDVFTGVGPFAIPAARRGCEVLANDLNPESFRWLQHNSKLNKASFKISLQGRCSVHLVRNVAPNKEMMCVSFTLPKGVLYNISEEPCPKKQKCEDLTD